jgi:predicted XRE-type DNA-binding protein
MTNTTGNNEDDFVTTGHPFEGLPNGEERLAKAQLARQINDLIKARGLKQKAASELLGITQPEVSQIANGRLSGFSFDRLYRCLHALDMDVEITIRKHVPIGNNKAAVHVSSLSI